MTGTCTVNIMIEATSEADLLAYSQANSHEVGRQSIASAEEFVALINEAIADNCDDIDYWEMVDGMMLSAKLHNGRVMELVFEADDTMIFTAWSEEFLEQWPRLSLTAVVTEQETFSTLHLHTEQHENGVRYLEGFDTDLDEDEMEDEQ